MAEIPKWPTSTANYSRSIKWTGPLVSETRLEQRRQSKITEQCKVGRKSKKRGLAVVRSLLARQPRTVGSPPGQTLRSFPGTLTQGQTRQELLPSVHYVAIVYIVVLL